MQTRAFRQAEKKSESTACHIHAITLFESLGGDSRLGKPLAMHESRAANCYRDYMRVVLGARHTRRGNSGCFSIRRTAFPVKFDLQEKHYLWGAAPASSTCIRIGH